MDTRTLTQAELLAEAKRLFGDDPLNIAFKCPICGDVATIREFPPDARGAAGQECIGRQIGALDTDKWDGRGCTFAAYGLIPAPWTITFPDRAQVRSFPLAEPAVTT